MKEALTEVVNAKVGVEVDALPPELPVGLHRQKHVKVAGGATALARVALTCSSKKGTGVGGCIDPIR